MRTKNMLAAATTANAASALATARARHWPDQSIRRHASVAVLRLMHPELVPAPKPRGRVSELQPVYSANPSARVVPDALVAEALAVRFTRYNSPVEWAGALDIGPARPKRNQQPGTTHNVTAMVPGGFETFTLSPNSVQRLLAGQEITVGIGGGVFKAQRVQ